MALSISEKHTVMSVLSTDFLLPVLKTVASQAPELNLIIHVGSVDSWPQLLFSGDNAAMIFNTHFQDEPGEHWIAVYIDGSKQEATLFDSMPLRPFPQLIRDKLSKLWCTIRNANPDNIVFQHPEFPLCGIYCLAFLEHVTKGMTLELCSNNPLRNDIDVLAYMWPLISKTYYV